MAIGRNFTEALGKALRSMETKAAGFWTGARRRAGSADELLEALRVPTDGRLYPVEQALRAGATRRPGRRGHRHRPLVRRPDRADRTRSGDAVRDAPTLTPELLRKAKRHGLSDRQIAALRPELAGEDGVRLLRHRLGIRPVYKTVDTCAAEFAARTPYHYSSYDEETEVAPQPEKAEGDHPRQRARTGSGRASSSTTPACTRSWRCARPATRP